MEEEVVGGKGENIPRGTGPWETRDRFFYVPVPSGRDGIQGNVPVPSGRNINPATVCRSRQCPGHALWCPCFAL